MAEPKFIDRNTELSTENNYKKLRAEYAAMLEAIAGSTWTDYNAHDPGITIMEYLCYALTELGYKTAYPLVDLLEETQKNSLILSDSFYPAYNILPSQPVTINDYRKLILDKFNAQIKNVWLLAGDSFNNTAVNGFYYVVVQPDDELFDDKEKPQLLKKEIAGFLSKKRNLCEDFNEVIITEPEEVYMEGDIDIDPDASEDKVLATIYHQIDQILSPDIDFYSFYKMQQDGYTLEEIFEGPLLENGFIRDQDLKLPKRYVYVSKLLKSIIQVKGVKAIHNFKLVSGGKTTDNYLEFEKLRFPLLRINLRDPDKPQLKIRKTGIETKFNSFAVFKEIEYLNARKRRTYKIDLEKEPTLNPQRGIYRDVSHYDTIQNEFPLVYGISRFGLPSNVTELRRAQALQLKSFLLVFEQVMANYLAQLSNVNRLLSFGGELRNTYFTQPVLDIPQIEKLFGRPDQAKPDKVTGELSVDMVDEDVLVRYAKDIKEIVTRYENFFDRRNRSLDHLLARFGEKFNDGVLRKLEHYFSKRGREGATLAVKSKFLEQVCQLTAERSKAFDYHAVSVNSAENTSVFEKRVRLLLGIHYNTAKSILTLLRRYHVQVYSDPEKAAASYYFRLDDVSARNLQNLKYITDEGDNFFYYTDTYPDPPETDLFSNMRFIDKDFFVNGIQPKNYAIRTSEYDGREHFDLLYQSPVNGEYLRIGAYHTWDKAVTEMQKITGFLKNLNMSTEAIRVIEHNLLLPPFTAEQFNFELRDRSSKVLLTLDRNLSYDDITFLVEYLNLGNIEVYQSGLHYMLRLKENKDLPKTIHVKHPHHYTKEEDAKIALGEVMDMVSDYVSKTAHPYHFFVYFGDTRLNINFFSSQLTVVLPALSARFNDEEFRRMAEQVLIENVPVHIYMNFLWLDMEEIEQFETHYQNWLNMKSFTGMHDHRQQHAGPDFVLWLHRILAKND